MQLNLRTRQLMIVGLALLVIFGVTTFATKAAQPASPASGLPAGGADQSFNFLAAFDASAAFMQSGSSLAIIAPDGQTSLGNAPVRIVVRVNNSAKGFRALLNRRDITAKFMRLSNTACLFTVCELVAEVTPSDGLTLGRNELIVETSGAGAGRQSVNRIFMVAGPQANAGTDQKLRVGQTIQLNGSQSSGAGPLTHQWTLVRKPAGSNAAITNPSAPNPTFVADVHGDYVVQLTVHDGYFQSQADTVTLSAQPIATPVYVSTFHDNHGLTSIQVGGKVYSEPQRPQEGVLALVLDRGTLEEIAFQYFGTGEFQPPRVVSFLNQYAPNSEQIIILQTDDQGASFFIKDLGGILKLFGATSEFDDLPLDQPYSFIGVRGWKPGQAYQIGGTDSLSGYFTLDVQENFSFILPFYEPYQLVPAAPGAGFGSIKVSGKEYTGAGASGQSGFHLVVVDRRAPAQLLDEQVYDVATGLKDGQGTLAERVNKLASHESNLVFLVSYGYPGAVANYNQLVRQQGLPQAIAQLGGNPYLILTLGATDTYSLIGAASPTKIAGVEPFPAIEASSLLTPSDKSGAIQGALTRGRRGNWFQPFGDASDLNSPIPIDFYQIAWQPAGAWPQLDTPGKQKAYQYLSRVTSCANPNDSSPVCADVRASKYTDFTQVPDLWFTNAKSQKGQCTPALSQQNGFTCDEFEAVRGQLETEYYYLTLTFSLRNALKAVATEIQSNMALIPGAIAQEVKEAIKPPENEEILFEIFDIFLEFVGAGAELKHLPGLSAGASFLSGMVGLSEIIANSSGGEPGGAIEGKVADIEKKAAEAFPQVLGGIDLIFKQIVSDWTKLQNVGVHRDHSDPGWKWDDSQMVEVARIALRRYYYQQLLAVTYGIAEVRAQSPTGPIRFPCTPPSGFSGAPEKDSVCFLTLNWPQDRHAQANYNDLFFITKGTEEVEFIYNSPPPKELLEKIFTSPREDRESLGVSPYDFFIKWPFVHGRYLLP